VAKNTPTLFLFERNSFPMLNDALRLIRVFHDMKQSDLAEKLGVSASYLSEVEKAKKSATLDLVQKYAEFFRIPVSSIMLFSEKIDTTAGANTEEGRLAAARRILNLMSWIAKDPDGEAPHVPNQ